MLQGGVLQVASSPGPVPVSTASGAGTGAGAGAGSYPGPSLRKDTLVVSVPAAILPSLWGLQLSNSCAWKVTADMGKMALALPWGVAFAVHAGLAKLAAERSWEHTSATGSPPPFMRWVVVRLWADPEPRGTHTVNFSLQRPLPWLIQEGTVWAQRLLSAYAAAECNDTHNSLVQASFHRERFQDDFVMRPFVVVDPCVSAALDNTCTLDDVMDRIMLLATVHGLDNVNRYMRNFGLRSRRAIAEHLLAIIREIRAKRKGDAPRATQLEHSEE